MEIGKRKVKGDGWQVSWTFVEGRESFDIAAMKEDGSTSMPIRNRATATIS
jgi:hypothetical protein